jgi:hypothetical protein
MQDALVVSIIIVGALILISSVFFLVKLIMIKPKYDSAPDEDDFDSIKENNSFVNISLAEISNKIEEDTMPKSLRG